MADGFGWLRSFTIRLDMLDVEIDGGVRGPTRPDCDFGVYCSIARYRNRLNQRSERTAVQRFDFDKDFFGYFLPREESDI